MKSKMGCLRRQEIRDEEKIFVTAPYHDCTLVLSSCIALCIVPNWKYNSVYPQLSWRTHLVCRGASRVSTQANFEAKTEVLKNTSTPEWQSGPPTEATQTWSQDLRQDPQFPLPCSRAGRQIPPQVPQPPVSLNLPPTITFGTSMADPKPNLPTACNIGHNGEKEFIVACKGRPFSILTSPLLPVPTVTYLDYNLIRDLNLRMSSLQCSKLFYGGEKLRVLGHISTTVQCIIDGSPLGNIQMKCHVVEDLKKHFNTHGIAGDKLRKKLLVGPKHTEMFPAKASAEPTEEESADETPKKKKRKKSKKTDVSSPQKSKAVPLPDKAAFPSPPRPLCQGIWIKTRSYNGWHPEHGYGGPPGVLRDCYQNRRSGQAQGEQPDCWDSEGPFHSENSASSVYESSDEYDDQYTNVSCIRQNLGTNIGSIQANDVPANQAMTAHPPPFLTIDEAREALAANAVAVTNSCPVSPNTIVKMINTTQKTEPVKEVMISKGKPFTKEDLRYVTTLRRKRKDVPPSLKHVPSLHGPNWCHADCNKRKPVPLQCGFHESWGPVNACSPLCNGGHCDHNDEPDNYEE